MDDSLFEVSQTPNVTKQIRDLARRANSRGKKKVFLDALKVLLANLAAKPTSWGDPLYRLKRHGACVFRGASNPLFVRYVVFEPERKVIILELLPMPMSDLD